MNIKCCNNLAISLMNVLNKDILFLALKKHPEGCFNLIQKLAKKCTILFMLPHQTDS